MFAYDYDGFIFMHTLTADLNVKMNDGGESIAGISNE
jgi:hypothetical protein